MQLPLGRILYSVDKTCKGLGINANDTFMMDFHREIFFKDFFRFHQSFSFRTLPQKNVLFFIFAVFGGCEDDLYISSQQMDGWVDTFITCKKTPH